MTGYGKAECLIGGDKYIVELRSVNGKNADISLKSSLIPREREPEVRRYLAAELGRGSIDLFITLRRDASSEAARPVNGELLQSYYAGVHKALDAMGVTLSDDALLPGLLKLPDVLAKPEETEFSEADWKILENCIHEAVAALKAFRAREGESLRADVLGQVDKIESYVTEVEKYERERIDAVRERILAKLAELGARPDAERLEQEMIFYIEKLDINEEKVRLRQHCNYFRETLDAEPMPGRKIGFIAQEMGREINTMGSKANHAEIQRWVVKMKDELEKIKEQSLNIL
ncbi:MAG: YicC family protein [Bacteroidales bacterium]|nr:YicC family protein [Bacteroidales bacterium]